MLETPYLLAQGLLDREDRVDFNTNSYRWRPHDLLVPQQAFRWLQDMRLRIRLVHMAVPDFQTLKYRARYIKLFKQLERFYRSARVVWNSDHNALLKAVSGFYRSYGQLLRLLYLELY